MTILHYAPGLPSLFFLLGYMRGRIVPSRPVQSPLPSAVDVMLIGDDGWMLFILIVYFLTYLVNSSRYLFITDVDYMHTFFVSLPLLLPYNSGFD